MSLEYCCQCEQPTGRAGAGEDSIYGESGDGPYCVGCWRKHPEYETEAHPMTDHPAPAPRPHMTPPPLLPQEDQTRLDQILERRKQVGAPHPAPYQFLTRSCDTLIEEYDFMLGLITDLAWVAANPPAPRRSDDPNAPTYTYPIAIETRGEAFQRALATRRGGTRYER